MYGIRRFEATVNPQQGKAIPLPHVALWSAAEVVSFKTILTANVPSRSFA